MRALLFVVTAGCGRFGFDALTSDAAQDAAAVRICVGLAATCGPMGNGSCCESPLVPGGTFFRGYDTTGDLAYADMTGPATVSAFRLDKYEVTVGRFRQFIVAGQGTQANPPPADAGAHPTLANSGWDASWNANLAVDTAALITAIKGTSYGTWTDTPGANETLPINNLDWYEAMAFCAWDGGFLPTEAESGYASSGGSLQRAYPWSSPPASKAIDCMMSNFGGTTFPTTACVVAGASNVGSLSPNGDGVWGQADLGGNVWEWVLDWEATPFPTPCNDCATLTMLASPNRIRRGGSFDNDASVPRSGYRSWGTPINHAFDAGVRCARTP